ncbi:hypothetical protein CLAIMM_03319 [Cladophialophora immunda]|nr:hypothetical protein CLAIMM_03319 [Cladophialophora immunda]
MGSYTVPRLHFTDDFRHSINGQLRTSREKRRGINPATEEPNPEVPVATHDDVDDAVAAARNAFASWSKQSYATRRTAIHRFADAIESYQEDFATLLTREQGKPVRFAAAEIQDGIRWLRELSNLELPEQVVVQDEEKGKKTIVRYTPLGVAVGIIPWNFPVLLACGKLAPALITGNTIIIKPSPFTPYSDLKLGELAQAFFPPGVVQVLSGDDLLGPWLTAHPGVDKISFTGSTATGKAVMATAARTLKRVTLELGGKDPAIVCKDVNVKEVAEKIATLAFFNSGQVCVAIKRIYVHEDIYKEFRKYLAEFTKLIKSGEGGQKDVFLGPMQNKMQYEKVKSFFTDITPSKWTVIAGGEATKPGSGYFITPTIIDKPPESSRIVTEEPFGPILPLLTWNSERNVIERANNTKMGLGASVWSNNLEEATHIARQLEAGSVWINAHQEGDPMAPFGGHKESGLGYEWGLGGLKSYYNAQSLFLKTRVDG